MKARCTFITVGRWICGCAFELNNSLKLHILLFLTMFSCVIFTVKYSPVSLNQTTPKGKQGSGVARIWLTEVTTLARAWWELVAPPTTPRPLNKTKPSYTTQTILTGASSVSLESLFHVCANSHAHPLQRYFTCEHIRNIKYMSSKKRN